MATCGGECYDLPQQSESCYVSPCCPIECRVGDWSGWSQCTRTCGSGLQTRSRTLTDGMCGGAACSVPASESAACNTQCCPVACQWGAWSPWTACSATCLTPVGSISRSRTPAPAASCGGAGCVGDATETATCTASGCPIDCAVSPWSTWSACGATCGAASHTRTRSVTQQPANNGAACPALSETVDCGLPCCAVPCSQSGWSEWSLCTATCGDGTRMRARTTLAAPQCGGTPCGAPTDSANCVAPPCATNCAVNPWSGWSACSQTCGTGEQVRMRTVATQPANGGAACPTLRDTQACTQAACTCVLSQWTSWSTCSKSCGGGAQTRSRTITTAASDCPHLSESQTCNVNLCAQDCQVSPWAAWSACSVTCGGGMHSRARTITTAQAGTGLTCPVLSESESCNTMICVSTTGTSSSTATTTTGSSSLQCSEFRDCADCADGGKTSPLRCQFCVQDGAQSGVCVSSSAAACPVGFGRRATSIAECAASTAHTAETTVTAPVVVTVDDVAAALGLAVNSSVPSASATVASGVGVQVRIVGDANDAMLVALSDGGGVGANGGLLRDGLAIELLFDRDRPVSLTRLVLGSWDAGVDSARLDAMNRDDAAPAVQLAIGGADSTLDEASLRSGFTRYVLVAGTHAEFSLKSFAFIDRAATLPPASSNDDGAANLTSDTAALGTTEIALIAAGGALLLCVVGAALAVFLIRRRRSRSTTSSTDNATVAPAAFDNEMHSFASFRASEYAAMAPLATMQPDTMQFSTQSQAQYAPAPSQPRAPPLAYDDPENVRENF